MSFNVNSKYGELMSSAKWNDRFNSIVGANAVLAGFKVEKISDSVVKIPPGKCIINGVEIESLEDHTVNLEDYELTGNSVSVLINYNHNPTKVTIKAVNSESEISKNELRLAQIFLESNSIIDIENTDMVLSLNELLNYIKENPGDKIFETIAERDEFPVKKLYIGFSCFVIETMVTYVYIGDGNWKQESTNAVHIGGDEPKDISMLWIDDKDEDAEWQFNSEILDEIRGTMRDFGERVGLVEYALTKELDSGYFGGILPGEGEEGEEEGEGEGEEGQGEVLRKQFAYNGKNIDARVIDVYPGIDPVDPEYPKPEEGEDQVKPNISNGAEGTVERILIKRGLEKDLVKEALHDGEFAFTLDTQKLYIGNKGYKVLIAKGAGGDTGNPGGGGSGNLTSQYLELIAPNGEKFRVVVTNEGNLYTYNSMADTAKAAEPGDAGAYKGLIINRVYGGGKEKTNVTLCSHSFIELYNNSASELNLKGLYIQYAGDRGANWQVLELKGIVKPYHSFLIRCAEHSSLSSKVPRFKIRNFDMSWDVPMSDRGLKVYLGINPERLTVNNPCNIDNNWSRVAGYIDMFVIATGDPLFPMDAFEKPTDPSQSAKGIPSGASITRMATRKDYQDTDHSFDDITTIDLMKADPNVYMPKFTGDGEWTRYFDKLKLDTRKPNMINICFGKDGNRTRTFTWQTSPTLNGWLKYRMKGSNDWIKVETDKSEVYHPDTNAIVHRVIIRDLEPGTYEYIAGESGAWSDQYEFIVKAPANSDPIRFVHTTDQQATDNEGYVVWKKAINEIRKRHEYDFHINTGDISNDGGEFAFQWRYYFNYAEDEICSMPHMTCCGNNDLSRDYKNAKADKSDPEAFGWYTTVEDEFLPSCYSWNYGYIHFVCLNSNKLQDAEIVNKQIPWLIEDLNKPENKKRWTIVYIHEAPYTIIKQSFTVPFVDVFAEHGVDLVICGHHHRYSRSKRMGKLGPNGEDLTSNTGFYTVMSQATGFKLMGKAKPPTNGLEDMPWCETFNQNQIPTYCTWDITYEKMVMNAYSIGNILPTYTGTFPPEVTKFDSLEITKPL